MRDFNIQTDHDIQHIRPDIVVLYRNERECFLIGIAMPGGKRIVLKEQEKIEKLQRIKTGSEKDLELVSSCGCSSCNWSAGSDIEITERLTGEVKHKE